MDTPQGLPPHAAVTLPNPDGGLTAIGRPLGQLPAPPQPRWQVGDESMRTWLQAKCEEDKRRQQEERTRQEELRLDRRKIEQSMLRESTEGGVPPHMIPLIFAGVAGRNLPAASLEWAQVYMAQISLRTQQQLQQQRQQAQQDKRNQCPPGVHRGADRDIPRNPYRSYSPLQTQTAGSFWSARPVAPVSAIGAPQLSDTANPNIYSSTFGTSLSP